MARRTSATGAAARSSIFRRSAGSWTSSSIPRRSTAGSATGTCSPSWTTSRRNRAKSETFRDHWGHVEAPEQEGFALWQHRRLHDSNYDPSLWFLAIDGDEIAGFSLCQQRTSEDPAMGWVNSLGVRRPWRRRGVAEALLYHSFGELRRRGQASIGLDVDASSLTGATRLYEKAGMSAIREFTRFEKELRPGSELKTQAIEDDS